jgi:prepilin-type N-terminal cleavage/methylation domain-containing protein
MKTRGFSLVELLVVMVIIALLAALFLPVFASAKARAKRTTCLANLKQINLSVHLYAGDNGDKTPVTGSGTFITYKELVKGYVGLRGPSSSGDKVFTCPADTFYYDDTSLAYVPKGHHEQAAYDFSSYYFNGLNLLTDFHASRFGVVLPGIAGRLWSAIKEPAKTVLIAESSAMIPYSWHEPKAHAAGVWPTLDNSKNMVSFVDGHMSYIKMYWNSTLSYPDGSGSLSVCLFRNVLGVFHWAG